MSKIVQGFSSGDYPCECGRTVHLYFNGGELDRTVCKCGLVYETHATDYYLETSGSANASLSSKLAQPEPPQDTSLDDKDSWNDGYNKGFKAGQNVVKNQKKTRRSVSGSFSDANSSLQPNYSKDVQQIILKWNNGKRPFSGEVRDILAWHKQQQIKLIERIEGEVVTYRHTYTVNPDGYVETEAVPLEAMNKVKESLDE